jgi:hypothetical protein
MRDEKTLAILLPGFTLLFQQGLIVDVADNAVHID